MHDVVVYNLGDFDCCKIYNIASTLTLTANYLEQSEKYPNYSKKKHLHHLQ